MTALARRSWVPAQSEDRVVAVAGAAASAGAVELAGEIERLAAENLAIHTRDCVNLNPATNAMNPRAERLMASGLGSRPSLGYPGDKYEMGLEAIEQIEVIAAELASEVFGARFAEVRIASGAMANLYAFMATTEPGDRIIAQPEEIAGHVTHHAAGAAGLYGLETHPAPIDPEHYTIDPDRLHERARTIRPKLITIAGSLNLNPHPVREVREIADEVGAKVLFDAAHLSGLIAGKAWQQPLEEGAHMMTMSTYKSLAGPPAGLLVTNDAELAERIDKIAFPGLTANFDAAKTAALAMTLIDWKVHGEAYAAAMVATARALADAIMNAGMAVFAADRGATTSHQFALEAAPWGGGQTAAKRLRRANLLTCGIGLPIVPVPGDLNGLRIGTPEVARFGMATGDMAELASFLARVLVAGEKPEKVAEDVSAFRRRFQDVRFVV